MAGVLAPLQVQVAAGALEVRGSAGVPLVDVEAEDPGGAGTVPVGEAVDLGGDQDAPLLGKEGDQPGEGGARRSGDVGDGGGGLGVVLHGNHLIEKSIGREEKSPPARSSAVRRRRNKIQSRHFRGHKVNCPEGAREGPLGGCASEITPLTKF